MSTATIRIRRFMTKHLLSRKHMISDILHPDMAWVPKKEIRDKLAAMHKTTPDVVFVFGFQLCDGKSTGFVLICYIPRSTKNPSTDRDAERKMIRNERKNRMKVCCTKKAKVG
ncbi:small ribosomal subunit protein eS24-like [Armigeres subalbatus]|uniref:small ribosomal subunit protein eS24-like n=1 Tax=Armigeres subalbatus TaxID=124917 RepID=UPI002ED5F091